MSVVTHTHAHTHAHAHAHTHTCTHAHTHARTHTHTHTHNHHGYVGVFPTNQPYLSHFLYKSTVTELVSSGYLKSNTPRADRSKSQWWHAGRKGERESWEKKGQNRHRTHYCSSMVFVEWVEMAAPGWVAQG